MSTEQMFIDALHKSTPATILRSEPLRSAFRSFLERGTGKELQQLFDLNKPSICHGKSAPASYQSNWTRREPDLLPKRPRSSHNETRLPARTPFDPSLKSTAQVPSNRGRLQKSRLLLSIPQSQPIGHLEQLGAYICACGISDYHRKCLINAAAAYVAPSFSREDLNSIWNLGSAIFGGDELKTRFSRLYDGQKRVQEKSNTIAFLSRTVSVLLRNDIDHRATMVEKRSLSKGRGRLSVALEQLAQEIPTTKEKISGEYVRSALFYRLIEKCGLGDLATLGADNNHIWQKDLSIRDVDFLISFRRRNYPEAEKTARQLDFSVASLMVEALTTCGWGYNELATGNTRFLQHLRGIVAADSLAKGRIEKAINHNDPVSGSVGRRHLRSEPMIRGQQTVSSHAREPAQPAGEQEGYPTALTVDGKAAHAASERSCRKRPPSDFYKKSKRLQKEATPEISQSIPTSHGQIAGTDSSLNEGSGISLDDQYQAGFSSPTITQHREDQSNQDSSHPFPLSDPPAAARPTSRSSIYSFPTSLGDLGEKRYAIVSDRLGFHDQHDFETAAAFAQSTSRAAEDFSSGNLATPGGHSGTSDSALAEGMVTKSTYVPASDPFAEAIRATPHLRETQVAIDSAVRSTPLFRMPEENDATSWSDSTYGATHIGHANDGHCYQLPENSDASAWSNFVNYCLPRVEDEYAWAAWNTYVLPQSTDSTAWGAH